MTSLSINIALPTIDGMLIKHVLSFYEICKNTVLGSKIRFSAQMSNNVKKYFETLRKHQLNMFWGF